MKKLGWGCIVIAIIVIVLFIVVSSKRELSSLENILFQVLIFILSVAGSAIISTIEAKSNTVAITHAKSAVRRLIDIYSAAESARSYLEEEQFVDVVNALLEVQMRMAKNAFLDWQDVVPKEIEKLLEEAKSEESNQ